MRVIRTKNVVLVVLATLMIAGCKKKEEDEKVVKFEKESISIYSHMIDKDSADIKILNEGNLKYTIDYDSRYLVVKDNQTYITIMGKCISDDIKDITLTDENGKKSVLKVEIKPKYKLYQEPYVELGQSMEFIKNIEKRTLKTETDKVLLFEGENLFIEGVYYSFEDNKLRSILTVHPAGAYKQVSSFIVERYVPVYINGTDMLLYSAQADIAVLVSYNNSANKIVVTYAKKDKESSIESMQKSLLGDKILSLP